MVDNIKYRPLFIVVAVIRQTRVVRSKKGTVVLGGGGGGGGVFGRP